MAKSIVAKDDRPNKGLFGRPVLEVMPIPVALLGLDGRIIDSNRAWARDTASTTDPWQPIELGIDYIHALEEAGDRGLKNARKAAIGINSIVAGHRDCFELEYTRSDNNQTFTFMFTAHRLEWMDNAYVVVCHRPQKQSDKTRIELEKNRQELVRQAGLLNDADSALRILVNQRDEDRRVMENQILCQFREMILPFIDRLKSSRLTQRQMRLVDLVEAHLRNIVSPFAQQLSFTHLKLTPTEIRVAGLIKDGYTSKEIANVLNLSSRTVEFHRANLRHKLGLKNTKVNLRHYLRSM